MWIHSSPILDIGGGVEVSWFYTFDIFIRGEEGGGGGTDRGSRPAPSHTSTW
jgi:hypothetical protein